MEIRTESLMQFTHKPDAQMVRGEGSHLWDDRGRRYLDFVQGIAVNCLGHSPQVVSSALQAQLSRVLHVGATFHSQPARALAELLSQVSGMERVFIAGSGAEANEAAVKLARRWGQQHRGGAFEVITAHDSFHGRTLAMTSATGKTGFASAYAPAVAGFPKVPFDDLGAVERAIGANTAAVMVEPMQGEAGVVLPAPGYLRGLSALCDRHGVLLILDEIQTGMARTGRMFAHQSEDVRPDIMTLGKGLGGGLPVSAMLARDGVDCFRHGDHGGTFTGHPLLCAGALAVVEQLLTREHGALRVESATRLEQTLRSVAAEHGLRARGRGHLWGLVLPSERAEQVRDRCFELGLLINAARPNVLRLMPALDVSGAEITTMGELLSAGLR